MKSEEYTRIICRGFCKFYREGKEELVCGTYDFLVRNLTAGELRSVIRNIPPEPDFSHDQEIRTLVCEKCDFVADGCDFREGLDAPPCGGYPIIVGLLKNDDPLLSMSDAKRR
jgi:hypothetical protein